MLQQVHIHRDRHARVPIRTRMTGRPRRTAIFDEVRRDASLVTIVHRFILRRLYVGLTRGSVNPSSALRRSFVWESHHFWVEQSV